MEPLYPDEHWLVEINWSRPTLYERLLEDGGSPHDDGAYLYLISARFSGNAPKALYIGQTYSQWVTKRLTQRDHKRRYETFAEEYPRHSLFVSHGYVTVHGGKLTAKRLDDIESILIYTNDPTHAHNVKNFYRHGVASPYFIENKGSRCTLPKTIALGVFVHY